MDEQVLGLLQADLISIIHNYYYNYFYYNYFNLHLTLIGVCCKQHDLNCHIAFLGFWGGMMLWL